MPPKPPTPIRLPASLKEYIDAYGANNLSGSITTLLERYRKITADACPELTESEWCAIVDANNGCNIWLTAGTDPYQSLWANVHDSEDDGLSEKWGISCRDLADRIRQLPLAGKAAVWDVAARFLASPRLNEISALELLKEAGAKIKGV